MVVPKVVQGRTCDSVNKSVTRWANFGTIDSRHDILLKELLFILHDNWDQSNIYFV